MLSKFKIILFTFLLCFLIQSPSFAAIKSVQQLVTQESAISVLGNALGACSFSFRDANGNLTPVQANITNNGKKALLSVPSNLIDYVELVATCGKNNSEDVFPIIVVKPVTSQQGQTGAIGPQGPAGPKGDKGDKGEQGIQGNPGATGATGPAGSGAEYLTASKTLTGEQGIYEIDGENVSPALDDGEIPNLLRLFSGSDETTYNIFAFTPCIPGHKLQVVLPDVGDYDNTVRFYNIFTYDWVKVDNHILLPEDGTFEARRNGDTILLECIQTRGITEACYNEEGPCDEQDINVWLQISNFTETYFF